MNYKEIATKLRAEVVKNYSKTYNVSEEEANKEISITLDLKNKRDYYDGYGNFDESFFVTDVLVNTFGNYINDDLYDEACDLLF